MRRSLLLMWLVSLIVLTVGTTYYADSPAFWLASGTTIVLVIRGVLSVMLLTQLFTQPPRNIWFRRVAGATAVFVSFLALYGLLSFDIRLLDSLAFLGSSLAIGLTALERAATEETALHQMEAPAVHS